jgi:transposase-like protein
MEKQTPEPVVSSSVTWETLESYTRMKIQEFVQAVLEEEVTSLVGRRKSERRGAVDAPEGYRNGYGKPRRLSMQAGTITVRRPRVRGLESRFVSRVLPLFARRTEAVGNLLSELYLHGLSKGDFELALRGLLGDGAPLSRRRRSRGCARSGSLSTTPGGRGRSGIASSCTCGRTGFT